MWKSLKSVLLVIGMLLATSVTPAHADQMKLSCSSYNPLETMFKDVCWSGMFPMKLMGATMIPGKSGEPADRTNKIICACGGDLTKGQLPRIGFTVGFWAPAKILDVTRRPYCLPSLGGMELPFASINFLNGGANLGRSDRHEAFANWTLYSFPLIYMLRLIDDGACPPDGLTEFDLLQSSPMFPNWNDAIGRYTTFINPEMLLFTGVNAMFAMPVDGASSTVGKPLNNLFWVAGTWGNMYPITGFFGNGVGKMVDPVQFTSLTGARALSLLHRLGMLNETVGNDNLCERNTRFIIRKDAYRWQFLAPSPEVNGRLPGAPAPATTTSQVQEVNPPQRFGTCTHATGSSTAAWGMWRDVPATGEDHSYLLFQWTDCCFGITP